MRGIQVRVRRSHKKRGRMPKLAKQPEDRRAEQLQKMIEEAQRQPGLNEILGLVYHVNPVLNRTEDGAKPASAYVGGASVGETPNGAIAIN